MTGAGRSMAAAQSFRRTARASNEIAESLRLAARSAPGSVISSAGAAPSPRRPSPDPRPSAAPEPRRHASSSPSLLPALSSRTL